MIVTHADARPVEPVSVDALEIGQGERYSVIVEAENPGAWTIAAASVAYGPPPARAVLLYLRTEGSAPAEGELPSHSRQPGRLVLPLPHMESRMERVFRYI